MAENANPESKLQTKEEEEQEFRKKLLEELHLMNRSLERIAERLGSFGMS